MFFHWAQKCLGRIRFGRIPAINWPPGSGSVIQDYGFADPDLTEIFTDPQHWVGNIPSGTGSPVSRKKTVKTKISPIQTLKIIR